MLTLIWPLLYHQTQRKLGQLLPAIKFAIHAGSEPANGIEKPAGQFADREKTIFVL